jgi:serine/threonine-protein kinase
MGVVYRVVDKSTGEERALKRLNREASKQSYLVDAFEREYQVLAGLDHPRIIRVFDYGVDETGPYYTMEFLEGRDLRAAAPLPYREACALLRDVATSLALLHARRLIHRDLSPANVRITPDGHCKLIDFGALASFGSSRLVVGTPPAIPPEALKGAPLDQRADLYSLGALAYWLLTERHAYPARQIEQLAEAWKNDPIPPSALVEDIPKELDALVLSLLSADPLARPASAAEVIVRLNAVGQLTPEGGDDADRLAQSFLANPRFVGRAALLEEFKERTEGLLHGVGAAIRIEAGTGMGRTRLLEEVGLRAQLAGAAVIRVDASTHSQWQGTARALVLRTLDSLPKIARDAAPPFRAALLGLGRDVEGRLTAPASVPPPPPGTPIVIVPTIASMPALTTSPFVAPAAPPGAASTPPPDGESRAPGSLDAWFGEVGRAKPIVIQVDNVDDADDASLGLLAGLAKLTATHPIMLVVSERERREPRQAPGLISLRSQCSRVSLARLSPAETLELVRSFFGATPHVERLADWLHGRTAGSPLHCVEVLRHLVASEVVRYIDGVWALPSDRPEVEVPAGVEDAILVRVALLTEEARALAECLSLQHEPPTLALCRLLFADADDRHVLGLLDELARSDILYVDEDGYRFSSTALRDALLGGMDTRRLEQNHRRLGEAFAYLAGPTEPQLRIEAGWHLIKGGAAERGADLIAEVTHDSGEVRRLTANLHRVGAAIEAALVVYKRRRRSIYARLPLLTALAYSGYYEDRAWGDTYGDEALDACEDLSGVRSARNLGRVLGKRLGLAVGLAFAYVRFKLAPAADRGYPFREMLIQLFGTVTSLTGIASSSLDAERADYVARVLDVFAVLPKRVTPNGIHEFCAALGDVAREEQAAATTAWDRLLKRFANPRYYPTLTAETRPLYVTGAHYARGSFGVLSDDGRAALESADALDAAGLKLYSMIASQIRFLYFMNRGEFAKAAPHREQVELHAAHVGSAWQVETWEGASLIPLYTNLSDVEALTRISARLEEQSRSVPSLKLYARLARHSLCLVLGESLEETARELQAEVDSHPARGFIGWASCLGFLARGRNELGQYAAAKEICERALAHITDADRQFVALFLPLDIQMAVAEAGGGDVEAGLARIDALLARFRDSQHPLVQGFLHEARARIAWMAGRTDEYSLSLSLVDHWFRRTGTPALIAKCERLAELRSGPASAHRPRAASDASSTSHAVTGVESDRLEPEARTVQQSVRRSREIA